MPVVTPDPFALLPNEILVMIWKLLDDEDQVNLLFASQAVRDRNMLIRGRAIYRRFLFQGWTHKGQIFPDEISAAIRLVHPETWFRVAANAIYDEWHKLKAGDFVFVVGSRNVATSFCRFVCHQMSLHNEFNINLFHVECPDVFTADDTKVHASGKLVNVVICNRVDGDVPYAKKIILLAPEAAITQFDALRCGPRKIIGVLPINYDDFDAFYGLRNLFRHYTILNAPYEVVKTVPKLWVRRLKVATPDSAKPFTEPFTKF